MELQEDNLSGLGLKILSYSLLAAGVLLISPFLLIVLVKIAPIGPLPISLIGRLLGVGLVAIFACFVAIMGYGIWMHASMGNQADLRRFYKLSLIRYIPVAIIGFIQMIYAARNDAFYVTAVYALAVVIYAGWLLRHDRTLTKE